MRVLVVVAHPDDETLGAGGTIARMVAEGNIVYALAFTDGVGARNGKIGVRLDEWRQAIEVLGIKYGWVLDYPDNQLDTVPMLKLARRVTDTIIETTPDLVITHHSGDLNIDHRRVREAVEVACRPIGKRINILAMEVVSSTEWGTPFAPNYFVDIGPWLAVKRNALNDYESELCDAPHPRSVDGVMNLARIRGDQSGVLFAEAFEVVRWFYDGVN